MLAACDVGEQTKQVAKKFSVSPAWVRRLKQRRRQDGSIAPRPIVGRSKPKLDEAARSRSLEWVKQKPDSTLEQLRCTLALTGIVATPGDSDLNGVINFDDYALIDSDFNSQGRLNAVPEPTVAILTAVLLIMFHRRRVRLA